MNKKMRFSFVAFLVSAIATMAFIPRHSRAATCEYIVTAHGDWHALWHSSNGWKCNQVFIDYWWDAFDFKKRYWDDGMGYYDPCNYHKPLAKTFNAMWHLGYVGTNTPNCNDSHYNMTLWAECYAASLIDELRCYCGCGGQYCGAAALYQGSGRVDLYWPFFYGADVPVRAAALVHEARHAEGCSHNARCSDGSKCDQSWTNGCSETRAQGAYMWEVSYLQSYVLYGWRTTSVMKQVAVAEANWVLGNKFVQDPCMRLYSNGGAYWSC